MSHTLSSRARQLLATIIVSLTFAGSAMATQYAVIYRFQGTPDGEDPIGDLLTDSAGNLYGTASGGGAFGAGLVYELSPPASGTLWAETVLYNFSNTGGDAQNPVAGLVPDSAGNLYGTTFGGGTFHAGAVYKLSPPSIAGGAWTESVLYSFSGGIDGGEPQCKLLLAKNGALVGTAFNGGAHGAGAVFKLTPPAVPGGAWTEHVLYSFTGGDDGKFPWPGVVTDSAGNLYGVTEANGVNGNGTAFKLSPPVSDGTWIETTLHSFGPSEGANPVGELVLDHSGNGDGMTNIGPLTSGFGCGVVFQLVPPSSGGDWTENILYEFTGGTDGCQPYSGLVFDNAGNLLGVNSNGGPGGGGAIFKLSPAVGTWTEATLHDFMAGPDGFASYSTLIRGKGGAYFGSTTEGGGRKNSNFGTVFEVKP